MESYIWVVLFSIIICSCLFTYVNRVADYFTPKAEVRIKITEPSEVSKDDYVWLYLIDGKEISTNSFEAFDKSGSWQYLAQSDGVENNTIIGRGEGSEISFPILKSCSGGFCIWKNDLSSTVDIEIDGNITHYDLYSTAGEHIQITPYEDSKISILIRAFIYGLLIILLSFLLIVAYCLFTMASDKCNYIFSIKYKYLLVVGGVFVCTYLFDIIWYKHGIINFNAFGDQPYYWAIGGVFAQKGLTRKIIDETARSLPCFRSYGIFVPSFIAQFLGVRLNISSYAIYFSLPSIVAAYLFGYVLPRIYELIHGKKVSLIQIFVAYISFLIYYVGNLVSIDGDLFGLVFFVAGGLYALLFMTDFKLINSILCALCFSFSVAIRPSYLLGVYMAIVAMLIRSIIACVKIENGCAKKDLIKTFLRKMILPAIAFAIAFILVCLPQVYINSKQGHVGLFAYDMDGAYGTLTTTNLEQGMDYGLRGYITGYPTGVHDNQIWSIKQNAGYLWDTEITMAQSFDSYAKEPLDTLIAIGKRLFAFIDIKFNVTLPAESWAVTTKFYLFSTLNYILLAVAVFCLVNKRVREIVFKKNDLLFWGILLTGTIAPMLAARLEWRQAMLLYLFYLSYVCPYCFANGAWENRKSDSIIDNKFLSFVVIFVFFCHAISLTMYH